MAAVIPDASLALKWVLIEPYSVEAAQLRTDWIAADLEVTAPTLFAYEVANAVHRRAAAGDIARGDVDATLDTLLQAVRLHAPDPTLVKRAVAIAAETGRPAAYDAQYVALAEALGCELWTADERLWNAVRASFPFVRWVGAR